MTDIAEIVTAAVALLQTALDHQDEAYMKLLVKFPIEKWKCNTLSEPCTSLIHQAACDGKLHYIPQLQQLGADISAKAGSLEMTPMHMAARNGHVECIELLNQLKADVNKCDGCGRSPIYVAAERGQTQCVHLLYQLRADVNMCDGTGRSPVLAAAQRGHAACIQLLSHMADVNKCDDYGKSPVYAAARFGKADCIKLLHQRGGDINKCAEDGSSPVYAAAMSGNAECIQLLHDLGADINNCNNNGYPPLFAAALNKNTECTRLLVHLGSDFTCFVGHRIVWGLLRNTLSVLLMMGQHMQQYSDGASCQPCSDGIDSITCTSRRVTVTAAARLPPAKYAVLMQSRLHLEPLQSIPEGTLQNLVDLCANVASETLPITACSAEEAAVQLTDIVNLLVNPSALRDMIRLRGVCTTTRRSAFPVTIPSLAHLELPTGVVENYVAGAGAALVSTASAHHALAIHQRK